MLLVTRAAESITSIDIRGYGDVLSTTRGEIVEALIVTVRGNEEA